MKKLILFLAAAMVATGLQAQENFIPPVITDAAATDTVTIRVESAKVVVIDRGDGRRTEITTYESEGRPWETVKKKKQCTVAWDPMIDLGFNNYSGRNLITGNGTDDDFLSLNTSKSVNVGVYPVMLTLSLTRHTPALKLQTGLGLNWNNYRFERGWTVENADGVTVASDMYRDANGNSLVSKSKLMTLYLNAPVILQWNIPVGGSYKHRFFLAAGVIGGLKLGAHTKVKYCSGGQKIKDNDSFNLNTVRYGLTFRAGYKNVGAFFNTQMSRMFEKNHGPELYPYSVGITLACF